MKHNDVPNVSIEITPQNYENIFNVYEDENGYFFYNLLRVVNFPTKLDSSVYSEYVTVTNDTWPLLAWKFYKNIKLWWVICSTNQIMNPVLKPTPGTKIKILNGKVVRSILNNLV